MTRTDFKFRCPKCGSDWYGSSGDGASMKGHCHGGGCRFSWDRSTEDYLHFASVTTTVVEFDSQDEFESAFRAHADSYQQGQGTQQKV